MKHLLALGLFLLPATAFANGPITFSWPMACQYGKDCFIQNYVDEDSTGAARDFTCGSLAYDGHKGTDIRLPNEVAMQRGVTVLAAADGTVRGTRDGMQDVNIKTIGLDAVKDKECGNGVVIHHGGGYETQYCHMMKGSILVKQGQQVKAGQALGRVGMSGETEFPHMHFEVRRLGRVLDPFTGEIAGGACGGKTASMWKQPVAYMPTALLGQGFLPSGVKPTVATIAQQARTIPTITKIKRTSPALIYWVDIMGTSQDDVLTLTLTGPNNTNLGSNTRPLTRSQALTFELIGDKATPEGLIPGVYKGTVTLKRKGQDEPVLQSETTVEVPF